MGFVLIGVLLCGLKLAGLTPVSAWSWWLVLSPFALAALWWAIADQLGHTQRVAMKQQEDRVRRRREANQEALGLRPRPGDNSRRGKWTDGPQK